MSASVGSDFKSLMLPVAIEVLGQPNEGLSSKTEKRFGSRGALSVDLTKGTWCDHSDGDRGGGVLDFLHVKQGLAKPDALAWLRERKHLPPETFGGKSIVAEYDYTDAVGNLVMQVVRLDPKDFRQRRPDPANPDKWLWKTAGIETPLYRLPEFLAAIKAGRTVYVAEGEKGVDALRKIGAVATCSPAGAGKWRSHHSAFLAGADVVLLPDNDEPGRKHADLVKKVLAGVAASVRVLALPGLPEKGDPFDWIAAGGTLDRLEALLPRTETPAAADTIAQDPPANDGLSFILPYTLQGRIVQPREWIVEDWLPVGSATLLFGDGGTGKTLLTQQLMTSCATGKPWLGLAVTRCRSLALFCEDDEAELHRRQDRINQALSIDFDDLDDMTWASGVGKDNALMRFHADGKPARTERLAEIKAAAIAFQARLIVLDTAADCFGGNENDRAQVRNFIGALNALAMEIGGAVLINAHPSRTGLSTSGDLDGGSTAWSNTARSRWSLARPKADCDTPADTDMRVLTRRKANYASIGAELRVQWSSGALKPVERLGGLAAAAVNSDAEAVFLALLARHNDSQIRVSQSNKGANYAPKLFGKAPDRQGITTKQFEDAMGRLLATKTIEVHNFDRPGRPLWGLKIVPAEVQTANE